MSAPSPILEVSRSYDGYVLVSDVTSMLVLPWRLDAPAVQSLVGQLKVCRAAKRATCSGSVETVGGMRVTFEWPIGRVNQAICDLLHHDAACAAHRPAVQP